MNMDPRLIEMLACPVSRAPVYFSEARQLIVCPTSKLAYPIKDGIPAMLPEDAIKLEDSDPLLSQSSGAPDPATQSPGRPDSS